MVEVVVATAISLLALAGAFSFLFFSGRSFSSFTNYADLDLKTQLALDKMSREIRQVHHLTGFASTNLTFEDYDGATLQYRYDPTAQSLTRLKSGITQTLLTNCDSLQFSIFQRSPATNSFQPLSTASVTNAKVIELTWNCYRTLMKSKANTECMQSAKIVIRAK